MLRKPASDYIPGQFKPKITWNLLEVVEIATGEKIQIKDIRFNPELHKKIGGPTGNKEMKVDEPIFKEDVIEGHICNECGFESKSKLGLSSHMRYKHPA